VVIARRRNRRGILVAAVLVLVACSPDRPETGPASEPVVVYAAFDDRTFLTALFDAYTKETGTIVVVRSGEPRTIVDDVIRNDISPPADLLLTPSVKGVYLAAEKGALRPIPPAILEQHIPPTLSDPDRLWAALTYRSVLVVYDPGAFTMDKIAGIESLAEPKFRARLCLTSSSNSANLNEIARLIDTLGQHDAELVVRGWVANLARPPFEADSQLLDAIEDGICAIGVVSSQTAGAVAADLATIEPVAAWADIEGMGIARHAHNPDGAVRLVEWLLSERIQKRHAASVSSHPAVGDYQGDKNVDMVAWLNDEAVKLADRARYR